MVQVDEVTSCQVQELLIQGGDLHVQGAVASPNLDQLLDQYQVLLVQLML